MAEVKKRKIDDAERSRWPPLESNPEVFTQMSHRLGLAPEYGFVDVFGLDDDCLGFVPPGTLAVVLLHPGGGSASAHRAGGGSLVEAPAGLTFIEQVPDLRNACGTVSVLHALANNLSAVGDGYLREFLAVSAGRSPTERGELLLHDRNINIVHCNFADEGQTNPMGDDEEVGFHFVCFTVGPDGHVFELDGVRRGGVVKPRDHGPLGNDSLLHRAARIVREEYVQRSQIISFSLMALTVLPPNE